METDGYAPFYHRDLDDASKLLRARVGDGGSKTRLFMPSRMGNRQSTFAYVAYAWVFVYAQRQLHPLEELPDEAPEGFAELRNEVMKFARGETEGEQPQTQPQALLEDEGVTSMFVTITDRGRAAVPIRVTFCSTGRSRHACLAERHESIHTNCPCLQSDLRCADCSALFADYFEKLAHRRDAHGAEERDDDLPSDL
jgi:hypothetical protein